MKKLINILLVLIITFISACNKHDITNTNEKVGSSKVTFFPVFDMKGLGVMSIVQGSTFTDPGVTAKEGANTIMVTTSGSVDANVVGLYQLTYTATNKDGFTATTT